MPITPHAGGAPLRLIDGKSFSVLKEFPLSLDASGATTPFLRMACNLLNALAVPEAYCTAMLAHLSFRICPQLHSGTWTILAGDLLLATHTSCSDAIDYALDIAETGWLDTGITTDVSLVDGDGQVCLWRAYGVMLH